MAALRALGANGDADAAAAFLRDLGRSAPRHRGRGEQHVTQVLRKLGLRSRTEAAAEAVRRLSGSAG